MTEQWLPISGYEGIYEVSDQGRFRSLDRVTTDKRRIKGRMVRAVPLTNDYLQVGLHWGGTAKGYLAHRLVMLTFAGPQPEGNEVRHLNGDRADNRLSNLAWGTHLDNMRDQRKHGTHRNRRKTHCPAGHPYEGKNLLVDKNGHRRCAICRSEQWLRLSARRSAERKAA